MSLLMLGAGREGGASAPAFVPTDLPMLAGWWDASDSSYTTGNVTLATNGQPVTQLRDKSGLNRHMTASTTPTFAAAAIKGKGVLQFNASATIQTPNLFNYNIHHLFMVVKHLGADKDWAGSDNPNSGDILFQADGSRKAKAHLWTSSGPQSAVHGTTINDNDIVIIEQWVDATTINVALNGGTPVSTVLAGTKGGTTRPLVIGSIYANSGTRRFAGQVAEIVLCTGSLPDATQRGNVITYLTNGWL